MLQFVQMSNNGHLSSNFIKKGELAEKDFIMTIFWAIEDDDIEELFQKSDHFQVGNEKRLVFVDCRF